MASNKKCNYTTIPRAMMSLKEYNQILGKALRSFKPKEQELDLTNPWDKFLSAAAYIIRSKHHTALQASPGQLVFGRDMFLPVKFVADWALIQKQKQAKINK